MKGRGRRGHTSAFGLVSNPDPALFRSAGCIASPARGRKGLATLARFSCSHGMPLNLQSRGWNAIIKHWNESTRVLHATAAMKRCSLCYCELPKDSTKRRRLHGTSSSFSLQALVEVSSEAGLGSAVPTKDRGADGPFLCLPCHSQLEKVSKLKANLRFLTEDVKKKLKNTAASLNVAMAQSGIASI